MVNTVEHFLIQQDNLHLSVSDRGLCVDLLCFTALTLFTTRRNLKTGLVVGMHSIPALKHQTPTWACSMDASKKKVAGWNDLSTFFPRFFVVLLQHSWNKNNTYGAFQMSGPTNTPQPNDQQGVLVCWRPGSCFLSVTLLCKRKHSPVHH